MKMNKNYKKKLAKKNINANDMVEKQLEVLGGTLLLISKIFII